MDPVVVCHRAQHVSHAGGFFRDAEQTFQSLKAGLSARIVCEARCDICVDAAQFLGLFDRVHEPANFVDKSLVNRVFATPDTAARHGVDFNVGHAAAFTNDAEEAVVPALQPRFDFSFLSLRKFSGAVGVGEVTAHAHRVEGNADLVEGTFQRKFSPKDAD